jgi:hypothetical protein
MCTSGFNFICYAYITLTVHGCVILRFFLSENVAGVNVGITSDDMVSDKLSKTVYNKAIETLVK